MNKLLFWIIVLAVGFLVWKVLSARARTDAGGRDAGRSPGPRRRGRHGGKGPELMIECAECGVHVPSAEAIEADGRSYCCVEHRDAHRRGQ